MATSGAAFLLWINFALMTAHRPLTDAFRVQLNITDAIVGEADAEARAMAKCSKKPATCKPKVVTLEDTDRWTCKENRVCCAGTDSVQGIAKVNSAGGFPGVRINAPCVVKEIPLKEKDQFTSACMMESNWTAQQMEVAFIKESWKSDNALFSGISVDTFRLCDGAPLVPQKGPRGRIDRDAHLVSVQAGKEYQGKESEEYVCCKGKAKVTKEGFTDPIDSADNVVMVQEEVIQTYDCDCGTVKDNFVTWDCACQGECPHAKCARPNAVKGT